MSLYFCAIHRYSGPLPCSSCSRGRDALEAVERFTVEGFRAAAEIIAKLTAERDALGARVMELARETIDLAHRVAELERLGDALADQIDPKTDEPGWASDKTGAWASERVAAWRAARKP